MVNLKFMKFCYTRVADSFLPGGYGYLPLLDVNFGPNRLPVKCLIDSGSPVGIFHSVLGVAAGLVPVDGKKSSLLGVGGEKITGYYHQTEISFYGCDLEMPVFLTADLRSPYSLLGQIGFFANFRVAFELKKREFEISSK